MQQFRALEERLLNPAVRGSREELQKILADDFLEFGSSGRIFDKWQTISSLEHEAPFDASVKDFCIRELSPEIVLVTYRSLVRSGEPQVSKRSLRSSVWVYREGRWQIAFHQGTLETDDEREAAADLRAGSS